MRLEITCGEAPYLCNRYDAVSGEYNDDVKYRIGLLDRKLRIVSENVKDSKEWILWAKIALRSTYGFEWQGDNLLLAREALFFTFEEHYIAQFGEKKFNQNKMRMMPGVAYIISWNIWQMDGLKFGLPGYDPYIEKNHQMVNNFPYLMMCKKRSMSQLHTSDSALSKTFLKVLISRKPHLTQKISMT